jgi:hypothetical protein
MPQTFNPGDRVVFNPTAKSDDLGFFGVTMSCEHNAGEVWEIVCELSPSGSMHRYRIKARQNGRKRIATAFQLRPAL